jgi:hypothetical protein
VDVILPVWRLNTHRRANLQHSLNFWKSQGNTTIRVMQRDDKPFNKQWLCNLGVKQGNSERFIIADVDAYHPDKDYLQKFLEWAEPHRWAFGYRRFIYEGQGKPERDDWPYPGIQEGGIVLFSRDLWEEMGGANEWIKMLRGPDNDIAMRAMFLSGEYVSYPTTIYHRWHPRSPYKQGAHVKHNKEILKYTRKNPRETVDLLKKQCWGNPSGSYSEHISFYEARK